MSEHNTIDLSILPLLKLKYKDKLNPKLMAVFWVQNGSSVYLKNYFADTTAVVIESLPIVDSDFLEDSQGELILDSEGNPLCKDYFNPFENILVNVNKFIYELDDFSKMQLVNRLFTNEYESFITKQNN